MRSFFAAAISQAQNCSSPRRPSAVGFSLAVLLVTLLVVLAGFTSALGPLSSGDHTRALGQARLMLETQTPANSTYCINFLGAPVGEMPEPITAQFYSRLCVKPEFVSFVTSWGDLYTYYPNSSSTPAVGARNFSVALGYSDDKWTDDYFALSWVSGAGCTSLGAPTPCSQQAIWIGNVTTGGNITGPTLRAYPLTSTGGGLQSAQPWGTPAEDALILVFGLAIAVTVIVLLVVRRSHRSKPPTRGSIPP